MLEADTMEAAGMSLNPIWGSFIRAAHEAGIPQLASAVSL